MASKILVIGSISLLLGTTIAFINMFAWSAIQYAVPYAVGSGAPIVVDFYIAQALSTLFVVVGLYELYRYLIRRAGSEGPTLASVMGEALASKHAAAIGALAAAAYGLLYAVFSSLLVYQPTVDFAEAYGATGPGWTYISCCGDPGTVPKLVVYLAPAQHLGMQLVPLSLLFLFVVPLLVGFNAVVSLHALRRAAIPLTGRWLATSGAVVGLFTACPTCAGLFLASSMGGIGTTLAVTLAPFQLLFIAVSIPVLLVSPLLTALSLKRSYEASCRVPLFADGRTRV